MTNPHDEKPKNPFGYEILRRLSFSSYTYLSRECASERLVILKYFEGHQKKSFEKEAKALVELEDFEGSPALYFATEVKEGDSIRYCLGMEFIVGKSLLELTQDKTATFDWSGLGEKLGQRIKRLHDHHGFTHGDLSPVNILIKNTDQKVFFVDWEFSEKISQENLSSYDAYRGTKGFNGPDGTSDLVKRDRDALQACLKYCGVLNPNAIENKANTSFLLKWLKGKKDDRK